MDDCVLDAGYGTRWPDTGKAEPGGVMWRPFVTLVLASLAISACDDSNGGSDEGPGLDTVDPTDTVPEVTTDTGAPDTSATDTSAPDVVADLTLDAPPAADTTPDTEPLPPIEPAVCCHAPYSWLGPDEVGVVQ